MAAVQLRLNEFQKRNEKNRYIPISCLHGTAALPIRLRGRMFDHCGAVDVTDRMERTGARDQVPQGKLGAVLKGSARLGVAPQLARDFVVTLCRSGQ